MDKSEFKKILEPSADAGDTSLLKQTRQTDLPRINMLRKLFLSTLYISAVTFGGGFVIVSFMQKKFVDELGWLKEEEMLDIAALAQSSPGAIAVNAAILVGWRMAGFLGMLTAVLGTIIPPMLIITVISFFYDAFASNGYVALLLDGLQIGVAAIILDVVFSMGSKVVKTGRLIYILTMALAFIATAILDVNVMLIIAAALMLGLMHAFYLSRKGARS